MIQLDGDLGQIEKQVLAWVRTPLNRMSPLDDLEGRIHSHEVGEQPCPGAHSLWGDEARGEQPPGPEVEEGNGLSRAQPRGPPAYSH